MGTIDFKEIFDKVFLTSGLEEDVLYPVGTAGGTVKALVYRGGINKLNLRTGNQVTSHQIEVYVSSADVVNPKENSTQIGVKMNKNSNAYTTLVVRKVIMDDGAYRLGLDF
jgi:hypothetical protein